VRRRDYAARIWRGPKPKPKRPPSVRQVSTSANVAYAVRSDACLGTQGLANRVDGRASRLRRSSASGGIATRCATKEIDVIAKAAGSMALGVWPKPPPAPTDTTPRVQALADKIWLGPVRSPRDSELNLPRYRQSGHAAKLAEVVKTKGADDSDGRAAGSFLDNQIQQHYTT
jgi:hypothetical protein